MANLITISDYAAECAIKDDHVEPRTSEGFLDREKVVTFRATLDIERILLIPASEISDPPRSKD